MLKRIFLFKNRPHAIVLHLICDATEVVTLSAMHFDKVLIFVDAKSICATARRAWAMIFSFSITTRHFLHVISGDNSV